jgi:cytochrome c nitrite reductase small subunit
LELPKFEEKPQLMNENNQPVAGDPQPDTAKSPPEAQPEGKANRPRRRFRFISVTALFAIFLGMLIGIGTFTFGYGKGASYLSNNPESCANCHAMQDHFDSWAKSSHHAVATCNDCHLPHDSVGKWVTKADNGFFHSLAFTLGNYKNPIQIKPRNKRVTQGACIHCHHDTVHEMLPATEEQDMLNCVHCHSRVGHAQR